MVLSPLNTAGGAKDEDASILLAADSSFYVAWLSNREGNDDLYIMRSEDGLNWSSPSRVTSDPASDWYPTLIQDQGGRFHLTWMRQGATSRNVFYNSSADGLIWDESGEVQITSGTSDDFVPYLMEHDGRLHVYFDSAIRSSNGTRNLFLIQSSDRATDGTVTAWTGPLELGSANSAVESDQFAFVRQRPLDQSLIMTWIRHSGDPLDFNGYLHPSTNIHYATSSDGVSWGAAFRVMSEDNTVNTMPTLYSAGSEEVFTWMRGVDNSPNVMELLLSDVVGFPAELVNVTESNGVPGWSPHVAPTLKSRATATAPHTFLRVWVGGADKRLYYQVFER